MAQGEPTIEEGDPILSAGAEWHSAPIHLRPGQRARVTVLGKRKVYANLFPSTDYVEFRNHSKQVAGFKFGHDKTAWDEAVIPGKDDDYYLVVKNGLFTPRQRVHIRVVVDALPDGT